MDISPRYPKAGKFFFHNLWEFKEAYESSEFIITNESGISFPRHYEDCNTQLGPLKIWMQFWLWAKNDLSDLTDRGT